MSAQIGASPRVLDPALVARLHARAGADRWGVSVERFSAALTHLDPAVNTETLHLDDLALAVACADGHEAAWESFLATYQAEMNRAAAIIAGGSQGQDLADALVADLFGLDPKGTGRRSLFDYFHGRSRLSTWLRALLSRRHIDALRAARRITSLDAMERPDDVLERAATGARTAAGPGSSWSSSSSSSLSNPSSSSSSGQVAAAADAADRGIDRARLTAALQQALDEALAGLAPNDRLRLAYYHVDELTLAQIGRRLGEHEATVSRKLTRIRQTLRDCIDEHLRTAQRLGPDEIRDCYRWALEDGTIAADGLRLVTAPTPATATPLAAPPAGGGAPRQESPADTF
jgi:RNA polymerase sigma factor (sigma-70 family)